MVKSDKNKKLTTKQQRFVDFYDGNATDAARKAGYKGNANTLGQVGDENLKKPKIAKAITERESKRNGKLIATRQERQEFWTKNMRDEAIEFKDRHKASELLGRSFADFVERKEITGNITLEERLSEIRR